MREEQDEIGDHITNPLGREDRLRAAALSFAILAASYKPQTDIEEILAYADKFHKFLVSK